MTDHAKANTHQSGGCYCGAVRYELRAAPLVKGQCHCAACQKMSGGAPHYFMLVPEHGFAWTKGAPVCFSHPDVPGAVTRFFCGTCGTQLITRRPDMTAVVVKVGTLDDPSRFTPRVAICFGDALPFHTVPDGIAVFDDLPRF